MIEKRYRIVYDASLKNINKSGFCSAYASKKEADEACKHWNLLAGKYGTRKAVVREVAR